MRILFLDIRHIGRRYDEVIEDYSEGFISVAIPRLCLYATKFNDSFWLDTLIFNVHFYWKPKLFLDFQFNL